MSNKIGRFFRVEKKIFLFGLDPLLCGDRYLQPLTSFVGIYLKGRDKDKKKSSRGRFFSVSLLFKDRCLVQWRYWVSRSIVSSSSVSIHVRVCSRISSASSVWVVYSDVFTSFVSCELAIDVSDSVSMNS